MFDITTTTLLSGAVIDQRPLTFADQSALIAGAKRRNVDAFEDAITGILAASTVQIRDPGPYDAAGGNLPWGRVLSGDRLGALLALRAHSYPEDAGCTIEVCCGACGERFGWAVDLAADIAPIPYPADSLARFRAGQPCACTLGEAAVQFHLMTPEAERRARRALDHYPGRDMAALLSARIAAVTVGSRELPPSEIIDWLDGAGGRSTVWPGLTAAQAEALQDAMTAADGGYDTEVEAVHPGCGATTRLDLPFEELLLRTSKRSERRRARRAAR